MSEISKDLLRPCPLCGGEAKLQESNYFRYARVAGDDARDQG